MRVVPDFYLGFILMSSPDHSHSDKFFFVWIIIVCNLPQFTKNHLKGAFLIKISLFVVIVVYWTTWLVLTKVRRKYPGVKKISLICWEQLGDNQPILAQSFPRWINACLFKRSFVPFQGEIMIESWIFRGLLWTIYKCRR